MFGLCDLDARLCTMKHLIAILGLVSLMGTLGRPSHAQEASEAHGNQGSGPHLFKETDTAGSAEVLDRLFAQLREAGDENTAAVLENAIQTLWLRSGSPTADLLMKQASDAMNKNNYGAALILLDAIVELNPDFAEGWNRRATLHFLRRDFVTSLSDIDRVLELEPRHYGALSGLGSILQQKGDGRKALKALRRARQINPTLKNLDERIRELEQEFDQKI